MRATQSRAAGVQVRRTLRSASWISSSRSILSATLSTTGLGSWPKVTILSRRLRNSGLKVRSSALFAAESMNASSPPKPTLRWVISNAPALLVMIRMTLRKSVFLPVVSVSVALSMTCKSTEKMSGWAFSISSSKTTECGFLVTESVS